VELYTKDADRRWEYRESVFRAEGYATRTVLDRVLPPPPARIADIGGGSGRWAHWLAKRGHPVALVDVVPAALDEARARDAAAGKVLESIGSFWTIRGASFAGIEPRTGRYPA